MAVFLDFRVPPPMFGNNHPGIDTSVKFGPLLSAASWRFDEDPIPFLDPVLFGGVRMDLHDGIGTDLPQPGDVAVR